MQFLAPRSLLPAAAALLLSSTFTEAAETVPPDPCAVYGSRVADRPGPPDRAETDATLASLWAWVRSAAAVSGSSPPPALCTLAAAQLVRLRTTIEGSAAAGLGIVALYDRRTSVILTSRPLDPLDPLSLSVIVHELVHHAQAVTGAGFPCPAAAEKQAYDLQAAWLAGAGLDLGADFGMDPLSRLVLTHCGI